MKHGKALLLALVAAVLTACGGGATAGPAAGPDDAGTGVRPEETDATRAAGVHLLQAGLSEGNEAQALYQEAMTDALTAVEETPMNPKAYLVAGQAAVGLHQWARADSMFDRAEELYPPYADQLEAEREEAWVTAYNLGAEAISADDTERALEMFTGADIMYQGRAEARLALGSLHMNQGDLEAAAEAYRGALEILEGTPPEGLNEEQLAAWRESRRIAALNSAELLAQTGDFAQAAAVLQEYLDQYGDELDPAVARRAMTALAGFYAQAGNAERSEALYEEILGREDLTAREYFQAGIGFFNTGDFARAAEAFGTAAELNPYSRDALLNLVQSLYSQAVELEETEATPARDEQLRSIYQRILDTGAQVRELDPLNRNLVSFMLRAYRSLADISDQAEAARLTQRTQELFREYQDQTYEVSEIQLTMEGRDRARITGTLTNLLAQAGESVQIRFEVLDEQGQPIDFARIEVTAPEQGSSTSFSATVNVPDGEFDGWRYRLVR